MKLKIILLIFIFGMSIKSTAQNGDYGFMGTQFNYTQNTETSHDFSFTTFFAFGSPGNCPSFSSEITFLEDTMFVKATYNLCGFWPQQGCTRNDITQYTEIIPATIQYIIMSTNVIDCVTGTPTLAENIYTRTYDRNLSSVAFSNNGLQLYPNPAKEKITVSTNNNLIIDKIIVYNLLGKKVIESTVSNSISVNTLTQGIYIIEAYIGEEKMVSKFVKE